MVAMPDKHKKLTVRGLPQGLREMADKMEPVINAIPEDVIEQMLAHTLLAYENMLKTSVLEGKRIHKTYEIMQAVSEAQDNE